MVLVSWRPSLLVEGPPLRKRGGSFLGLRVGAMVVVLGIPYNCSGGGEEEEEGEKDLIDERGLPLCKAHKPILGSGDV
jgi:hypothetical protein